MLIIALLTVLGVDLVVIVALAAGVLSRRRWVRRQPDAFAGAIRAATGEVDGVGPTWRRGHGRWVRDVLVWTKAPFLFRNVVLPADGLVGQRYASPGEVKRLGADPFVVTLATVASRVEVAVRAGDRRRVLTPFPGAELDASIVPAHRPAGTVVPSPDN